MSLVVLVDEICDRAGTERLPILRKVEPCRAFGLSIISPTKKRPGIANLGMDYVYEGISSAVGPSLHS